METSKTRLEVLYEDNHLIAVNKPAGAPVQADSSGDRPLVDDVAQYLKTRYDKPGAAFVGLVHRIDRPVSGLVLFAKTSKALARMNEIFQGREVRKEYLAVVENCPDPMQGTLEHFLAKNAEQNKSFAVTKPGKNAKKAILDYALAGRIARYSMLRIDLRTGRHHQIRCQLAKIGSPIRGDLKYGAPRSNPDGSISLHSYRLSFTHPVSRQPVRITAPLPRTDNVWREFGSLAAE